MCVCCQKQVVVFCVRMLSKAGGGGVLCAYAVKSRWCCFICPLWMQPTLLLILLCLALQMQPPTQPPLVTPHHHHRTATAGFLPSRRSSSGSWQRAKAGRGERPPASAEGRGDVLLFTKYFHLVPTSSLRLAAEQVRVVLGAFTCWLPLLFGAFTC